VCAAAEMSLLTKPGGGSELPIPRNATDKVISNKK